MNKKLTRFVSTTKIKRNNMKNCPLYMAIVVSLAIGTKNADMVNMTNQTWSAVTSFSQMTIVVEDVAEVKVRVMSLKMQTSIFL